MVHLDGRLGRSPSCLPVVSARRVCPSCLPVVSARRVCPACLPGVPARQAHVADKLVAG